MRAALPAGLLTTKLFVPPPRRDWIARPRLAHLLERGLRGRLTLIAAPAGFGKSTLVSAWRAAGGPAAMPVGWIGLDAADNDPLRFWSYVLAALEGVAPGVAMRAIGALQSPQPPPLDVVLTGVLNALNDPVDRPDVVLVLDDYHVITNPRIQEDLAWFLDYLPPRLHVVMLTRADPPLPLARLRARGDLVEVRADDLRFSAEETALLLAATEQLTLADDEAEALAARSEGWAAGLQLAALALRDRPDRREFLATFSGSNRFIVDYLASEVLGRLPAGELDFLLRTSILQRLSGDLCDAVLADGPAGVRPPSAATLEALERRNLFVVPLDEQRHWFRYHHLFADVLRQRLTLSTPPDEIRGLHARASTWHEEHGLAEQAIDHAIAAEDWGPAARLLEHHALRVIVGGRVQTVLGWIERVPAGLLSTFPRLAIARALALLFAGDLRGAESSVALAEATIPGAASAAEAGVTDGLAAAVRANIAQYTGDIAGCVAFADRVLRLLPEDEVIARTTARVHVAKAFRVSGDVSDAAERAARAAVAPVRDSGNVLAAVSALANVARLERMQGRLRSAAATYREMLELTGGPEALRGLYGSVAYYVGMADLHREWNELDAAASHLDQALRLIEGRVTVDADDVATAYLATARVQAARGDEVGALEAVGVLGQEAQRRQFVPELVRRIAAERARLSAAGGDASALVAWAASSGLDLRDPAGYLRESECLALARASVAGANASNLAFVLPRVLGLLDRLLADASAQSRGASAIEILVVRAEALWAGRDEGAAVESLARALALAEPDGFVRRFLDEGPALEPVLRAARARGVRPGYVGRLLSAAGPVTSRPAPVQDALFEPLSPRELEVLRLMAGGRSNGEIAQAMTVEVSTVKTHVNRIFGKLAAGSRAEALDRGREVGLL